MNDWLRGHNNMRQGAVHLRPPWWWGQDLFDWSFIHLYLTKNPHQPHPKFVGREKKRKSMLLSTWPSLQERVSKVTSHQTLGPLKHIWVAPAGPKAIRILTERREPEQHKNGFSQCKIQDFANNVFLVRRVKFGLFKRFALNKHCRER